MDLFMCAWYILAAELYAVANAAKISLELCGTCSSMLYVDVYV